MVARLSCDGKAWQPCCTVEDELYHWRRSLNPHEEQTICGKPVKEDKDPWPKDHREHCKACWDAQLQEMEEAES